METVLAVWFVTIVTLISFGNAANIQSAEEVQITANPTSMHEGFTKELSLMCSFLHHDSSDFSSLMSLILSKTDSGSIIYNDIASISNVGPVDVKDTLGAQVSSQLKTNGMSFINYTWTYPTEDVKGSYKCELFGMLSSGRPTFSMATTTISEQPVDVEILLHRMKEMDIAQHQQTEALLKIFAAKQIQIDNQKASLDDQTNQIDSQKASIDDQKNQIDSQKASIDDQKSQLNSQKTFLESMINTQIVSVQNQISAQTTQIDQRMRNARSSLIKDTTTYGGHEYLLSYQIDRNGYVADFYCRMFGGYLVEIGSDGEFNSVNALIKNNGVTNDYVMIAGRDEATEGWWVSPYDGYSWLSQPYKYSKWASGEPGGGTRENCRVIQGSYMKDLSCTYSSIVRFMCEIP